MSNDTFSTTGTCEGCSSHFSLFKRKVNTLFVSEENDLSKLF